MSEVQACLSQVMYRLSPAKTCLLHSLHSSPHGSQNVKLASATIEYYNCIHCHCYV